MAVEGKKARIKAQERNATPSYGVDHQRPFAVNTGKRGPLDKGRAQSARENFREDEQKIGSILVKSSSTPALRHKPYISGFHTQNKSRNPAQHYASAERTNTSQLSFRNEREQDQHVWRLF